MDKLEELSCFASTVYIVKKPEFLESVIKVSDRYLKESKNLVTMTGTYSHEPEIAEFAQYVSQTAWNILASQGYSVDKLVTYFTEMWTQEHKKYSSMDCHIHGNSAQISAFYFLTTPKDSCRLVIHDPRPAKVIISLANADDSVINQAAHQIVFTPDPGTLIFANSWLPHSFSRNGSDEPMQFVHMNLSVSVAPQENVEII
jgi:hypothetical protein